MQCLTQVAENWTANNFLHRPTIQTGKCLDNSLTKKYWDEFRVDNETSKQNDINDNHHKIRVFIDLFFIYKLNLLALLYIASKHPLNQNFKRKLDLRKPQVYQVI